MVTLEEQAIGVCAAVTSGYGFQTVKSEIGYGMKSESLAHFPEN